MGFAMIIELHNTLQLRPESFTQHLIKANYSIFPLVFILFPIIFLIHWLALIWEDRRCLKKHKYLSQNSKHRFSEKHDVASSSNTCTKTDPYKNSS